MLPEYDVYVMGFREREHLVPTRVREQVAAHGRGKYEGPAGVRFLLMNGVTAGLWERKKLAKRLDIRVAPVRRVRRAALEREVERFAAFFGLRRCWRSSDQDPRRASGRKRSTTDDLLRVIADAVAKLTVGGDDPERWRQPTHVGRDAVVGRLGRFPDDGRVVSVPATPFADELLKADRPRFGQTERRTFSPSTSTVATATTARSMQPRPPRPPRQRGPLSRAAAGRGRAAAATSPGRRRTGRRRGRRRR